MSVPLEIPSTDDWPIGIDYQIRGIRVNTSERGAVELDNEFWMENRIFRPVYSVIVNDQFTRMSKSASFNQMRGVRVTMRKDFLLKIRFLIQLRLFHWNWLRTSRLQDKYKSEILNQMRFFLRLSLVSSFSLLSRRVLQTLIPSTVGRVLWNKIVCLCVGFCQVKRTSKIIHAWKIGSRGFQARRTRIWVWIRVRPFQGPYHPLSTSGVKETSKTDFAL